MMVQDSSSSNSRLPSQCFNWKFLNLVVPPQHLGQNLVREAKEAGQFMPGSGQYPVDKLSEDQLRLLRTHSDLNTTPPPLRPSPPSAPKGAEPNETARASQTLVASETVGTSGQPSPTAPIIDESPMVATPSMKNTAPMSPAPSLASMGPPEFLGKTLGCYKSL